MGKDADRYHLAIICENAGGNGSVARVANRHVLELTRFFKISLFSDSLPGERVPGVNYVRVCAPKFDFLRRYCHVPNQWAFVTWAKGQLERVHREQPINGVLCHSHAAAALAATPFGRKRGIPFALVTHGDIFDVPAGSYDSRLTWFYKTVHPSAYRNAALIVALSPHMARCALAGGADPARVHVLPNGFDHTDIGMNAASLAYPLVEIGGPLRLLFVGRLAREKGVDVLLHAARLLVDQQVRFNLRIVGNGPEAERIKELCAELGISEHVKFSGTIPPREMGDVYQGADLVCVPSRRDPLPTVVLEAMASGRPVIGSNDGGIPFMISDKETGILVEPGSAEALAREIAALALNRRLLRRMGECAASVVRTRFAWPRIGEALATLVWKMMTARATPSVDEYLRA